MRGIGTAGLVLMMAASTGCHSTTSLQGDTRTDTRIDPADAITDTAVDPATDAGPPDVGPDGGVDVLPVCPEPNPPPYGPNPYFEIDDSAWPLGSGEIESHCLVEHVEEGVTEYSYHVSLICMDTADRHTIYVRAEVPIRLDVARDDMVEFWYAWDDMYWNPNRWFALAYRGGGLIMAGGEGLELPPVGPGVPPLDPLVIEEVGGISGLERDECGTFERTGIRVQLHSESRVFHDRTHGSVGSMESAQVIVGPTLVFHDLECDDAPDRWVSGLVFMVPEG